MPTSPPLRTPERAIVIALGWDVRNLHLLPRELVDLGSKPVIAHVLDRAARSGVSHADIIVSDRIDAVCAYVGDGTRWGLTVNYHVVEDVRRPHEAVLEIANSGALDARGPVLLLSTDLLVGSRSLMIRDSSSFRVWANEDRVAAAIIPRQFLAEFAVEHLDYAEWQRRLLDIADLTGALDHDSEILLLRNPKEFLEAQRRFLSSAAPGMGLFLSNPESSIWIGRGVSIHASAQLVAPVLIADHAEIEAGAIVGPNVSLGEGATIGAGTRVEASVLAAGSTVAERLSIKDSIVGRGAVYNIKHQTGLLLSDRLLISDRRTSCIDWMSHWLRDLIVTVSFVSILPLTAVIAWAKSFRFCDPSATDLRRRLWHDLVLRVLPQLGTVFTGRRRFFGAARMESQIGEASHLTAVLSESPLGVVSHALIRFGPNYSEGEALSLELSDALATRSPSRRTLLFGYLSALTDGPESSSERNRGDSFGTAPHRGETAIKAPRGWCVYVTERENV